MITQNNYGFNIFNLQIDFLNLILSTFILADLILLIIRKIKH